MPCCCCCCKGKGNERRSKESEWTTSSGSSSGKYASENLGQPAPIPASSTKGQRMSEADKEIARYDQEQLELEERERRLHVQRTETTKVLTFYPPQSNDKPRTSQEVQRWEEYNKPLYQTNEGFRAMSLSSKQSRDSGRPSTSGSRVASNRDSFWPRDSQVTALTSSGGQTTALASSDGLMTALTPTGSLRPSHYDPHPAADAGKVPLKTLACHASADIRNGSSGYYLSPAKRNILNVVQIKRVRDPGTLRLSDSDESAEVVELVKTEETGEGSIRRDQSTAHGRRGDSKTLSMELARNSSEPGNKRRSNKDSFSFNLKPFRRKSRGSKS